MRTHAKLALNASIHNDTLFLSKLNVMDYSLLVCACPCVNAQCE